MLFYLSSSGIFLGLNAILIYWYLFLFFLQIYWYLLTIYFKLFFKPNFYTYKIENVSERMFGLNSSQCIKLNNLFYYISFVVRKLAVKTWWLTTYITYVSLKIKTFLNETSQERKKNVILCVCKQMYVVWIGLKLIWIISGW